MTRPAPYPGLTGRSVLTLRNHTPEAIATVLDLAHRLRATPWRDWPDWLPKRTVGLIFERPSTRTRVAFETGIGRLGGQSIHLSARDMQLGRGEALEDTALILSGMVDALVLRTGPHEKIVDLARFASIPVVNALTYEHHPCQGLADLMTLQEVFGDVRGLPVAYVGDGNNCCISLVVVGAKLGLDVTCACPEGYDPDPEVIAWADAAAGALGGGVRVVRDPAEAAEGVRAIYTDTWVSMGDEEREAERTRTFTPYRVDAALMARAASDAVAMHPLPAHHEEEITYEVLHGAQSVAWQQGHNRLYTQAALMALILADPPS
jgi:ornithine carbamoyltransferase